MAGWLGPASDRSHRAAGASACTSGDHASFTLTVLTSDVDAMVGDPRHRSPAFGLVVCPALEPGPIAVHDGSLELFVDADPGVLEMRYRLDLRGAKGRRYVLLGVKDVRRRRWFPTVLTDTTTLLVDVWEGAEPVGSPRLRGVFTMGIGGVMAQGLSFRGGPGAIVRYLGYYVRRCVMIYLGAQTAERPDPIHTSAAPRRGRPQGPKRRNR